MRKILAVVLSVAFVLSGFAINTSDVRADYTPSFTTVGSGNGWQYMTTNEAYTGDEAREDFQVEGGTTWDDYPHFIWYGYPTFPWDLSPTNTMTAGLYAQRVNEWNKIAFYFRSPLKTIQKTGKYRVTWNAQHDLDTYYSATRYFIQLLDKDGNSLYKNKHCPKCDGDGSDCPYCVDLNNSTTNGDPESHECICCNNPYGSCIRCEYEYFGADTGQGEDQELSFDVDLQAGEQVRIQYARNNGYGLTVKQATINELHTITIGDDEYEVEDGDDFHLPAGPEYGYLIDDELYPSDNDITVDKDIVAIPINTLNLNMQKGACIRLNSPAGIAYQTIIETESALLNSNVFTAGTLITPEDYYDEFGKRTLDLDSKYLFINVENIGWLNNTPGYFRGGVINILPSNYDRDFVAKSYVTLNYVNNTKRTVYSSLSDIRNIKQVANALIERNDETITDFIRTLAES